MNALADFRPGINVNTISARGAAVACDKYNAIVAAPLQAVGSRKLFIRLVLIKISLIDGHANVVLV